MLRFGEYIRESFYDLVWITCHMFLFDKCSAHVYQKTEVLVSVIWQLILWMFLQWIHETCYSLNNPFVQTIMSPRFQMGRSPPVTDLVSNWSNYVLSTVFAGHVILWWIFLDSLGQRPPHNIPPTNHNRPANTHPPQHILLGHFQAT